MEALVDQPFWAISTPVNYHTALWKAVKKTPDRRLVINNDDVFEQAKKQRQEKYGGKFFAGDLRYDHFEHTPILKLPTSFRPDHFFDQGLEFVSPKLFELLDQPRGSLQGIQTETIWFGPDYPDWEYLWLSFIPQNPAIDTSRCDPEDLEERFDAATGKTYICASYTELTPLLASLTSPFGTFRAAEKTSLMLVSDAVALSILQAGCTGLEFNHVETKSREGGPLYRRSLHGPEIHPRQLNNK